MGVAAPGSFGPEHCHSRTGNTAGDARNAGDAGDTTSVASDTAGVARGAGDADPQPRSEQWHGAKCAPGLRGPTWRRSSVR